MHVLFRYDRTQGWIGFTLLSEMPSFLTDQLGFDLSSAGLLSVVPYAMLFLATTSSGKLFCYLQDHRNWTVTDVRQCAQFVAFTCSGGGLIILGFINNVPAAFTVLIFAQATLGIATSGFSCSFLDIAPNYSALLNSIANTIGAMAGIVGPICVGIFTSKYEGNIILLAFMLCCVVVCNGMICV